MKKMVYAIMEYNCSGDDFEKNYTFDIDEARAALKQEAEWGYNVNHKNPDKTRYVLNAYEVDTDEIDEDFDYDINDAKSLLSAYADSQCWLEPAFDEEYSDKSDDDVTPVVPNPAPARDTTKRYYKDCDRAYIGDSDVASLTCTYFNGDKGVCSDVISFGGDNSYYAYICKDDVEIGDHYRKVLSGRTWIRLYDDKGLTYQHHESGYKFDIYRAGDFGVIIHWYKDGDQDDN